MRDLRLTDGDLTISGLDLQLIDGGQAVAQRLTQKLKLFRGEWFLDRRAGVPYFRDIIGQKTARSGVISTIIKRVIQDDPDVDRLESFGLEFDGVGRNLEINFSARLTNGSTIDLEVPVVV